MNKFSDTMTCNFLFAQIENNSPSSNSLIQFFIITLMFIGMWFLIIAPQRKRQKKHETMINSLKSNDQILTASGMFGTITNIKHDRFIVKIADKTKVEIARSAIQSKITN